MRSRVVAFAGWMVLATASAGCTVTHTAGEPRMGQGKLYVSDNPTYDEFFEGVHAVQKQTTDATEEEAKARAPLEQALGTRSASPERLVDLTRERVRRGREGSPLHFLVTGLEPKKEGEPSESVTVIVRVPDEAAIALNQREVVNALDQTGQAEAQIADKFEPASVRAHRLLVRHDQLRTTIDRDFSTRSRQEEVSRELAASKTILSEAADRADKASNTARSFLKQMAAAFPASTAGAVATESKSGGAGRVSAPGKVRPKPVRVAASPAPTPKAAPMSARPTAPAPEVPPKPAPTPKSPDDFNP